MVDQTETIDFLSRSDAYGSTGVVERCETHGSIVFLVDDRAYKLKRSVRYPYMDYSTVVRRKAMCDAELAVNHRLAPEIYLGVRPVVKGPNGELRLGQFAENEGAVDWLVVMRRFKQDMLLDELRKRGEITPSLIRKLAESIAEFHAHAEIRSEFGGSRATARVVDENMDLLRQMAGQPFDPHRIDRLETLSRQVLDQVRSSLDARQRDGHVRRCHGDLHLKNICMFNGTPMLFDAVEFRDDFAYIDVLYDLAFVLMDLERHGLYALSNALLNRYLERTRDYAGLETLPLFLSCRAAIRAHVTMSTPSTEKSGDVSARAVEATRLLDVAIEFLESKPLCLVAIGGMSGAGKSTVAAEIAPLIGRSLGAIVLRSDVVRKELWSADDLTRLPDSAYESGVTQRVYSILADRASQILAGGYSVVVDAVFGKPEQRAVMEAVARDRAASFHGFWLEAAVDVLERRLSDRRGDASDATVAVLHTQLVHVDAPTDWYKLKADVPTSDVVANARQLMRM